MHGIKKFRDVGVPDLDLKRLEEIRQKLPTTPIVLHGASGIKKNQIEPAIKLGVRIINIDTELRLSFTEAIRDVLDKDSLIYDPRAVLTPAMAALQAVVEEKIKMFGSAGKY